MAQIEAENNSLKELLREETLKNEEMQKYIETLKEEIEKNINSIQCNTTYDLNQKIEYYKTILNENIEKYKKEISDSKIIYEKKLELIKKEYNENKVSLDKVNVELVKIKEELNNANNNLKNMTETNLKLSSESEILKTECEKLKIELFGKDEEYKKNLSELKNQILNEADIELNTKHDENLNKFNGKVQIIIDNYTKMQSKWKEDDDNIKKDLESCKLNDELAEKLELIEQIDEKYKAVISNHTNEINLIIGIIIEYDKNTG